MKINIETEVAEAGYVILLDPATQSESEGAEYYYLNPDDRVEVERSDDTHSADPMLPHDLDSSNGPGPGTGADHENAQLLPMMESTKSIVKSIGRAQYEGFHIAHYQVERAIGRGGMGDVYLARDLRLGRPVAIKLLRADYQPTKEQVNRIEHEARAVCALNHPNIVTIYEIGEVEGAPFIVSEFIEGDTLRQMLPRVGMRLDQALEIVIQIANAIASAHQMGIIHRDIKPENVMVRSDGYVKVLDFGLAKLSDALEDRSAILGAIPGVVLGTVNYMSPEQARGEKVDARSDVFSLGILLYELVTGRKPFEGKTTNDVIAAILKQVPAPIADYKPDEPAGIQHIINQALRKNRDERYATMLEMIRDLRELKNDVALIQLQKRRTQFSYASKPGENVLPIQYRNEEPNLFGSSGSLSKSGLRSRFSKRGTSIFASTQSHVKDVTSSVVKATSKYSSTLSSLRAGVRRAKSGAEPLGQNIKPARTRLAIPIGTATLVLIIGLAAGLLYFKKRPLSFNDLQFSKFVANGQILETAISQDGKFVVFSQAEPEGKEGLWLRQAMGGTPVAIVPSREVTFRGMSFSDDGNHLFFLARENKAPFSDAFYQMTLEGGGLKKLNVNAEPAFDVSPDSKYVSFIRALEGGEKALIVAEIATGNERQIASRSGSNTFRTGGIAWSEDGESIACGEVKTDRAGIQYDSLVAIGVKDGSERPLSGQKWSSIGRIASLRNDRGWMIVGSDTMEQPEQLWYISSAGEAKQVSNDPNGFKGLSVTRDGRVIAATQVMEPPMEIWLAPANDFSQFRQITRGGNRYYSPSWTPEGNIITDSGVFGADGIWKLALDGSRAFKITGGDQKNLSPVLTQDSRYLIVQSIRNGRMNLWSSQLGANKTVQLTQGENDNGPCLSPDGTWIFYESLVAGKWGIWKVPLEGGTPEQVVSDAKSHFSSPAFSQDGKWLAIHQSDIKSNQSRIVIVPSEGGKPAYLFDLPATAGAIIRWAYGGQGLTYVDERSGASEIWFQPLNDGQPRQLTHFGSDKIFSFAWSPDGKYLMATRGARTSEAVLISHHP